LKGKFKIKGIKIKRSENNKIIKEKREFLCKIGLLKKSILEIGITFKQITVDP